MAQVPPSLEQAVEIAMRRIRAAWPAQRWTPDSEREYRNQLTWIADAQALDTAITTIIRTTTERFAPPIGQIVNAAQDHLARRRAETAPQRGDVKFLQAKPDPRDAPGTIRWIVQQPDGRLVPRSAVPIDDVDGLHITGENGTRRNGGD